MGNIKRLIVSLDLGKEEIEVGELLQDGKEIYFKYFPDFIKTQLQISPFKLPLTNEIVSADTDIFDGLFGVFNDSLPDGWGRLILDKTLISKGISLNEISPLDRLSFVGKNGMGALNYRPASTALDFSQLKIELDKIADESKKILEGTTIENVEELFQMGGSSGGARPKIFVGYHPSKRKLIQATEILPEGFEHWIIKFSSSSDPTDMAEIEYAYYKMALDAGLKMSTCRLFKGKSGKQYFGTKRFDRNGNQKIHLHSASGLMHDNFRLSNMDYGHLMDAAFRLENNVKVYEKVLRLAAFNVFAHNRDDHSKNFSFLMNEKGAWQFSPVYDLTFSYASHGFHSTTIGGEGQNPNEKNLLELANSFGVKKAEIIFQEVKLVVSNWKKYAKKAKVGKESTELIQKVIKSLN